MVRKAVKVYLSHEQRELLKKICRKLGMDESEAMKVVLLDYAKSVNLVKEQMHSPNS